MDTYAVINFQNWNTPKFPQKTPKNLDLNYLKHLIHYTLKGMACFIETKEKNATNKYVPIGKNAQLARHDKHKKHIEYLTGNNFTKRKSRTTYLKKSMFFRDNYITGKKPFSYKPSTTFKERPLKVDYITNKKLAKKMFELETKIHPSIKHGKYKFLKKYFVPTLRKPNALTINIEEAINLCKTRYKTHKNYNKYLKELMQIVELHNGVFRTYYNKDTDGRLHTNLTRLPKAYRKYLKYNNSHLVEVDLSSSILFFISALLRNSIPQHIVNNYSLLLMINKTFKTIDIAETQEFLNLSISGEIYAFFIPYFKKAYTYEELSKIYKRLTDETFKGTPEQYRKIAKKRILAMLFAKTNAYTKEQEIFQKNFPEILSRINIFKNKCGYEKFSHALFQLEAYFMIDLAAKSFNKKYHKSAPIFTLHDCLITTSGYESVLKDTMHEVFNNTVGMCPNMETKEWI